MPNWVENIVRFDTSKVMKDCIKKHAERETLEFDFNEILPMPKILDDEGNFDKLTQEERLLFLKENDGCDNWYSWRLRFWGCKWNASETQIIDGRTVKFQTPWSMPDNIFRAISKKYNTTVTVLYADESWGYNCGLAEYENGEEVDYESKDSDEGFSEKVWYEEQVDDFVDETWRERWQSQETQ